MLIHSGIFLVNFFRFFAVCLSGTVVPMFVKKNRQKQKKSVKICKFITQKKTANK